MSVTEHKKRILFLITALYGGGAERVCCILASALSEKYDVTVAYGKEREKHYPLAPGIKTVLIPKPKYSWFKQPMKKLLRPFLMINRFHKLKEDLQPDVTVSFLYPMNRINVLTGGRRTICSERANPEKIGAFNYFGTKIQYRLADYVVFQSKQVQSKYSRVIQARSTVIQNPVSLSVRASEKRAHRVVTIGRLVKQKNQSLLIRSFAKFHDLFPEYTLTIYGEGPLRTELQELAISLGLSSEISFPGNLEKVHNAIMDAEMFVLSSDFEGLSNALLECMTMGIACISTRCEGSTDVIRDGENGLLVETGDEEGLKTAMVRLAEDPLLRSRLEGQACKDAAAFSTERIVEQWEKILFKNP